jgi:hypothetical protein
VRQTFGGVAHQWCMLTRYHNLQGCPRSSSLGNGPASAKSRRLMGSSFASRRRSVKQQLGMQRQAASGQHARKQTQHTFSKWRVESISKWARKSARELSHFGK